MHRPHSPGRALVALVILSCLCAVAHAGEQWELAERDGAATVHTLDIDTSDVDVMRGQLVLPYSSEEVARIVKDMNELKNYVPSLKVLKVLSEEKGADGAMIHHIYQLSYVPAFDDRDVVLKSRTWSESTPDGAVWRSTFESVSGVGPTSPDGVVRMASLKGGWEVRPTSKGTVFTYTCHAEVGGNLPDFLVSSGQVGATMDILKGLRARLKAVYGAR